MAVARAPPKEHVHVGVVTSAATGQTAPGRTEETIFMDAVGYKLFRKKDGRLYPLFVNSNKEVPLGVWVNAENGERHERGQVKSRLGGLAFRPGWHINSVVPYVDHIYTTHNGVRYMKDNTVWCEVLYHTDISYQEEAHNNGVNASTNHFAPMNAYIKKIPVDGYYEYRTKPDMKFPWVIAGEMCVTREMTISEVKALCGRYGLSPLVPYKKVGTGSGMAPVAAPQ